MDDLESDDQTNRAADPVRVEELRIASPGVGREDDHKSYNLREDVYEENRESLVQLSPKHDGPNCKLQYGMGDPKTSVDKLNLIAHDAGVSRKIDT